MPLLFSYGTLQLERVQLETYGRLLTGEADSLYSYALKNLEITHAEVLAKSQQRFHPIAIRTENPEDLIKGMIFEITEDELIATDRYEVSNYVRVLETFTSGKQAWVYVAQLSLQP